MPRKKIEPAAVPVEGAEAEAAPMPEFVQLSAQEARTKAREIANIVKTAATKRPHHHLVWCYQHQPKVQRQVQVVLADGDEEVLATDPTIFLQQLLQRIQSDPEKGAREVLKAIRRAVDGGEGDETPVEE